MKLSGKLQKESVDNLRNSFRRVFGTIKDNCCEKGRRKRRGSQKDDNIKSELNRVR